MTTSDTQSNPQGWRWLLLFAALVLLRLALPFRDTDTMLVHSAVVDSLLKGHNWGRQALVGSLEYPLLPTLALLVARIVCIPLRGLNAGSLLVAACQVWTLFYVGRFAQDLRRRWQVVVGLATAAAVYGIRDAFGTADPAWVVAPLLAATVYHLARWHRARDLRDAVLAAANVGLLVFVGLGGIAFAAVVLVGMTRFLTHAACGPAEQRDGLKWMIWTPFCYCLLLLLLWNWLIMDSPFFLLGHTVQALHGKTTADVLDAAGGLIGAELGWFALAAMLAAGLFLHPGHQLRPVAVSVTVGMLVVALVRALLVALALHPAGCGLVQATGTVCLLGLSLVGADWHGHRTRSLAGLAFLLVGLVAGCLMPGMPLATEAQFAGDAPTVEDIIADIDEQRVAVYGMRASAIYHDPHDTRFVARIDFHQGLFLEQGGDEILHLLVPPDDDRFYPARVSPFSSIHAEGRPWLLLEKSWPSGWQLWRCVITPERHSHLDGL